MAPNVPRRRVLTFGGTVRLALQLGTEPGARPLGRISQVIDVQHQLGSVVRALLEAAAHMDRIVRARLYAKATEHAATDVYVEDVNGVLFALLHVLAAGVRNDPYDPEWAVLCAAGAAGAAVLVPDELRPAKSRVQWEPVLDRSQTDQGLGRHLRLC